MNDPAKSVPNELWEGIERIGRVTLTVAALSYVVGFCVVCIHSAQFGVSSLELLKPYYILAGLWLVLPLVSIAVMSAFAVAVFFSAGWFPADSWKGRLKRFAWALGIWLSLLSIVFAIVARYLPSIRATPDLSQFANYSRVLRELAGLYCWITGFTLFGLMFWRGSHNATQKHAQALMRSMAAVFAVFLMLVSLEYLVWFSRTLFPLIPQSLGGGKPIVIRLISSSVPANGNELSIADEARLSMPCQLLLEQTDSFVVRFPSLNGQVLRLEKDAYAGYLMVPEGGNL